MATEVMHQTAEQMVKESEIYTENDMFKVRRVGKTRRSFFRTKINAEDELKTESESRIAAVLTEKINGEQGSWERQVAEARAYDANPLAETPLIDAMLGGSVSAIVKAAAVASIINRENEIASEVGAIVRSFKALLGLPEIPTDFKDDSYWT